METTRDTIQAKLQHYQRDLCTQAATSRRSHNPSGTQIKAMASTCYNLSFYYALHKTRNDQPFPHYINKHKDSLSKLIAIKKKDVAEFISCVFKISALLLSQKMAMMVLVKHQHNTEFNSTFPKQLTLSTTQLQMLYYLETMYIKVKNRAGDGYKTLYKTQPFPHIDLTFIQLLTIRLYLDQT